MLKDLLVRVLRQLRLLGLAEEVRFVLAFVRSYRSNRRYQAEHPDISFPPPRLLYETSSAIDYRAFWETGVNAAAEILGLAAPHLSGSGLAICDWGCGGGRVIRQFPAAPGPFSRFIGTDYDRR